MIKKGVACTSEDHKSSLFDLNNPVSLKMISNIFP